VHTLHATLSAAQEAIVLALRQSLYLPLDDLLFITKQYINADVSRSGIARLLKCEGMARLEDVIPKAGGETIAPKKTFKDYEPGFVHSDIKYLPQMPDETSRRYLFVAIDRATRWFFMHIYSDMSETSSVDLLRRLNRPCGSSWACRCCSNSTVCSSKALNCASRRLCRAWSPARPAAPSRRAPNRVWRSSMAAALRCCRVWGALPGRSCLAVHRHSNAGPRP
jgi:hypothetical protein